MFNKPIPVHILTGFLGSGKTTVLNYLVGSPQFSKTFVIINEFGEIGLDHLLVESTSETLIEMNSGCICCTIRGDLNKTLKDIQGRLYGKGQRKFDRVVIETTGLADPAPIIHTVMTSPELIDDYDLQSVIATIDATCFDHTQEDQFEARKQTAVADCLILTKTDLVEEYHIRDIKKLARALNPSAPIFTAVNGVIDIDMLFSTPRFSTLNKEADVKKWLDEEAYRDNHDHHYDHHHDVNRHGEDIAAFCITREEPVPEKAFTAWTEIMMNLMGEKMLRIKGIVNIEEYDGPFVIHGVQHIFYPPYQLEKWPEADTRTRLVFITKGISRESLEISLRSLAVTMEEKKN